MSINIGVFSLQQFHNLQQSLGNDFRPGTDYPQLLDRNIRSIAIDHVIDNVNLGNGQEYYQYGFPDFKIIRNNFGDLKLTFDEDSVENWSLPEPNVDGLQNEYFHLIYDNNGTPIGVKLYEAEGPDWLYFIELEDNISPHDPDTFDNARYRMEANNHLSSNPEEKRGESDNPAAPAAVFPGPPALPWWAGGRRRKKRTKKKSRKRRKKRKKKTKKRRKKRKRKKRKTRR